jgi:putative tryptophan/tyrosine transport system substrate-binding protein
VECRYYGRVERRDLLAGLLTALAAPLAVEAQPKRKTARIGVLGFSQTTAAMTGPTPTNRFVEALLRGLRELGYVYGEHFVTEPRGAEGKAERYPDLAAELVRLQVDVIVAVAAALPALKQATRTIPVVMAGHPDPVGAGFVQSLGRPGGNITGLSLQSVELTGKRVELLRELVQSAAPIAVLWDRRTQSVWAAADTAARARGWKLLSLEVADAAEIEAAFRSATGARAGGLLASAGRVVEPQFRRVAELAARHRLPVMYEFGFFVEGGGLMSYGADLVDVWRRSATFVDRILKGRKTAELPVEQPSKFELVINLAAAHALGLAIPNSLRMRADRVLE